MNHSSLWNWRRLRWWLVFAGLAWASIFAVLLHVKVFTRTQLGFAVDGELIVTSSELAGLARGDRILAAELAGRRTPFPSVFAWLRWLDEPMTGPVTLHVRSPRDEAPRALLVHPGRRPLFPKALYTIIPGLITLLCALYLARRPDVNPIFPFLVLTEVATYVLVLSYTNLESIAASPPLLVQFFAWNVLAPPALVLFFLRTPTPMAWGRWPRAGWLFVPSVLQFLATVVMYVRLLLRPDEAMQGQFLTYTRIALPVTNLGYGLAVVALMILRIRSGRQEKRLGILYLGYGFVLSLLGLTSFVFIHSQSTAVAQILGGNDLLMVLYSVLAVSLTMSTSSKWTRILDRWVHRGFVYGAITAGILVLYIGLSWLIGLLLTQMFGLTSRTVTIWAAVLATAGLFSVRHVVQEYVDRLFFKTRYRYAETLRELGERMSAIMELPRLLAQLVRIVGESVGLTWARVYRFENHSLTLLHGWGEGSGPAKVACPHARLGRARGGHDQGTVLLKSRLAGDEGNAPLLDLFGELDAECLVLLEFQGDLLGVLALGAPAEANVFSRDEVDLLASVGKQAAVAMKNALSYSTILSLSENLAVQKREIERLKSRLEVENVYLQQELLSAARFGDLVGACDGMLQVRQLIEKIAPTDATVIITGESGTGKELVARTIHGLSARAARPLVVVNCAAIPENLLESELFGHVKGAFTGAARRRIGQFELADESTLFLDEIGEMPLALQSKLLRVLQEREFHPVGSETPVKVDVRILTATNRDLSAMVKAGTFREDLYYRIHVVPVHLPPLRARGEDIALLAQYLLELHARRMGRRVTGFTRAALDRLRAYAWPGNVRELANVIERAVALSEGPVLDEGVILPVTGGAAVLQPHPAQAGASVEASNGSSSETGELELPYKEAVEAFRRHYILRSLERTAGNKSEAARLMGVNRPYLHRLIKELGLAEGGDEGE
ncbi:sigma-54-dependent Fis family transcriptional regulator [Myxococcota bacterium]|nr:sigma-54-dependent Fis family transcriptional regulator [Myxococcota bacterium]